MDRCFITFIATLVLAPIAGAKDLESLKFFENKVRPLLAERCFSCHGEEKQKGGLRLDEYGLLMKGGSTGPALVAKQPEKSLLITAVRYGDPDLQMPPKEQLSADEVAILEQWVKMGAPWTGASAADIPHGDFTDKDRQWWAIQPVKNPAVPDAGEGWARNEIDRFVAQKLASTKLAPAKEASRAELVRRAYFDLHGLPPTPSQVDTFVNDKRSDAWERLIDDLLKSPRYGERWGQHWLDVVRWAESDGYRQDAFRPHAWPYRDYIIRSFNEDKPYDQFVREQLAGDEINPNDPNVFIGTAYLRNGLYEYNQRNVRMHWDLIVNELTNLTGEAFLGVGIGCAQCHDHKFDPILQDDYFRLKAFLAPVRWRFDVPLATPEETAKYTAEMSKWQDATKEIRAEIDTILEPRIQSRMNGALKQFPDDIKELFAKAPETRTPYEQQLVELADIQVQYERERFAEDKSIKGDEATRLATAKEKLAAFAAMKPAELMPAFVATDVGSAAPEVLLKSRKGAKAIAPGFLSILDPAEAKIPASTQPEHTGRRLALANWIASPSNPLSTRVMVNRLWQHHFGAGIVLTPNDFGRLGELPSHPELLDWLTTRFVANGWKMKDMHRLIMNSAAYRQTAVREPSVAESVADPLNRLLWRFPPRRLDAEQVRDAMLAVSGELKTQDGGPSASGTSPVRSIFVKKIRNTPDDMLKGFDAPMGFESAPLRDATTTAIQSLLMINGEWPLQRATAMAKRLTTGRTKPDAELVREAYQLAFGREPSSEESNGALEFLGSQMADAKSHIPAAPADPFPNENGLRAISQAFGSANDIALGKRALWLQPGSRFERLNLKGLPVTSDDFTIQAVTVLDNLFPDSSVRTLAGRWNGDQKSPGWVFGVTSTTSKYGPANLIVQMVGDDFQGTTVYEVVASGLTVPLGKPLYLAAVISTTPTPAHQTEGSVTFYLKDLSDPKAKLQTTTVYHPVIQRLQIPAVPLLVGGRDQKGHLWDGQMARLAIADGLLRPEQLFLATAALPKAGAIDWQFNGEDGEQPAPGTEWLRSAVPVEKESGNDRALQAAVTDFCHALFNSNEFLYLH